MSNPNQQYTVSLLGTVLVVGAFLLYLLSASFASQQVDPYAFVASLFPFFLMSFLLIGGLVLAKFLVGVRFVLFYNANGLMWDLTAGIISFVAIYLVNRVVPFSFGLTPLGNTAFAMLSGVTEEVFFRLFLCSWLYKVTRHLILAVPLSSAVWAWFHLARYGASMDLIWLVFFAGLPLGYFAIYFRSADGTTLGHMLANLYAGLFGKG